MYNYCCAEFPHRKKRKKKKQYGIKVRDENYITLLVFFHMHCIILRSHQLWFVLSHYFIFGSAMEPYLCQGLKSGPTLKEMFKQRDLKIEPNLQNFKVGTTLQDWVYGWASCQVGFALPIWYIYIYRSLDLKCTGPLLISTLLNHSTKDTRWNLKVGPCQKRNTWLALKSGSHPMSCITYIMLIMMI